MLRLRPAAERGRFDHGWLDTRHTFSFADYYDPRQMGFRALRVINEDRVLPGRGFGEHGHREKEILSFVLSGALQHRDSLGCESTLQAGEVQRMTAGAGVLHSEFNPSPDEPVHFYQVWLRPHTPGLAPAYEQGRFDAGPGGLRLVAAGDGRNGALRLDPDADVYFARLAPGEAAVLSLAPGRHAWVQAVRGGIRLNDQALTAGDGAAVSDEAELRLQSDTGGEALLFDLA